MAKIQKRHSRSKPVAAGRLIAGTTFVENALYYTAEVMLPGPAPYAYFDLVVSEDEMLTLVAGWLEAFRRNRPQKAAR